jgi:CheY-like chemotaxis protein
MTKITDRPKILIVEDNGPIVGFMNEILTKEGYCIIDIVATGREAIEIALDTRPDLILMDIKLRNEMDGITAYERIKEKVDIPVVYVSAYADEHIIARANQSSPGGFIVKPFKIEQLIAGVKEALDRVRAVSQ